MDNGFDYWWGKGLCSGREIRNVYEEEDEATIRKHNNCPICNHGEADLS